jgi:hypothetical protein
MKHEFALLRSSITSDPKAPTAPARKELRQVTDRLINDALLLDDLPELVLLSADTMVTVASTLLRYEIEPDVRDLVEATQALIESSRAVMDRGLLMTSWETVRCGAVMVELTVRGLCAALTIPYDDVLAEVHRARQAGENPAVRRILTEAGLIRDDSAGDSMEQEPGHILPAHHSV